MVITGAVVGPPLFITFNLTHQKGYGLIGPTYLLLLLDENPPSGKSGNQGKVKVGDGAIVMKSH